MVKPRVIKSGKSGWKAVSIDPSAFTSTDLQGLLGIEELTDYSIKGAKDSKKSVSKSKKDKVDKSLTLGKSTTEMKKKPKKKKKKAKKKLKENIKEKKSDGPDNLSPSKEGTDIKTGDSSLSQGEVKHQDDSEEILSKMSSWNGLGVPQILLRALADKSFLYPTKIQALTLPPAIFGRRDILGAAETGSGKTLAFGLPILNGIIQLKKDEPVNGDSNVSKEQNSETDVEGVGSNRPIIEDINFEECEFSDNGVESDEGAGSNDDEEMEPEECEELENDSNEDGSIDDDTNGKAHCVKVIDNIDFDFPIMGKSKVKSKSQYTPKPLYALILTPTRELAVQISEHLKAAAKYTDIAVSVVVGGLASQKQERILNRGPEIVVATPGRLWELIHEGHPHLSNVDSLRYLAIDETDRMLEKGHFEELQKILEKINDNEAHKKKRQNFVFSATLTMTHEPPRYVMKKKGKKKGQPPAARLTPAQKLSSIMKTVGLTDPKIVDITDSSGVAQKLTEAQIVCSFEEKDYYLYYFLQRHPGRTLVFCNSIEAVRRLSQLFTFLGCSPWPLHAKMHQKQRLKNLERFCADPKGILLATDVAARGLDIPNVQHVIHYQTPRTAEGYVHRSGRTARAQQEGLTVLLMEPSEVSTSARLFRTLGRDSSLPTFPVEMQWMPSVKQRVDLARRVDKLELQARRVNTEHGWFDKLVKEMDLEMSDDELPTSYSRDGANKVKKQAAALRKQLTALLSKPLIPKGFSSKYPTQTGKLVVPLFPGSIPLNQESYEETAVQVLKQSVEDQKALKRKMNSEKSKRNKRRKRLKKQDAVEAPESSENEKKMMHR
ncbi:ATP-dependent RNA helicase DDX24, partial [Frankliniella fusca]